MGAGNDSLTWSLSVVGNRPSKGEVELTVLGPGYGESLVLHIGEGAWVLVDSCIDSAGTPRALEYLTSIGVDAAESVGLIVATHWHDDHIRGMAKLVEECKNATFSCAGALTKKEFLATVYALENRHFSFTGSGVREMYRVFSCLSGRGSTPILALADRRIFSRGNCEVWALSPNDANFLKFLKLIGTLSPDKGQSKTRVPDYSPNEIAVALWVEIGDAIVLLGSDLERPGWKVVLQSQQRPKGAASGFKIPHHGSANADYPDIWAQMLEANPYSVLTPWRRGNGALPSDNDVQRILSNTTNAYATARHQSLAAPPVTRAKPVSRSIKDAGVVLRRVAMPFGAVRLRRSIGSGANWRVETFGSACHLTKFFG